MNFSILFDSNECTALGNILEIFISYKLHLYNWVLVVIKEKVYLNKYKCRDREMVTLFFHFGNRLEKLRNQNRIRKF